VCVCVCVCVQSDMCMQVCMHSCVRVHVRAMVATHTHTHTHHHHIRICSVTRRRCLSARSCGRLECATNLLPFIPRFVTPTLRCFFKFIFSMTRTLKGAISLIFFIFITADADTNSRSGLHFLFPFVFFFPSFIAVALTCTLS
jgi:hypothetical protein